MLFRSEGLRHFDLACTRKGGPGSKTVLILSRDITQRRLAEDEARQAREDRATAERDNLFKVLFHEAPVAMAIQRAGQVEAVNQHYMNTLKITAEDIRDPARWFQNAYPDAQYRAWVERTWGADIAEAQAGNGRVRTREYRVRDGEGNDLDLLIGGQILGDGLVIILQDITPLQRAKEIGRAHV